MKSQEEFLQRWQDEFTGLLMRSFREANRPGDLAETGRQVSRQLVAAMDLLRRMYADLAGIPEVPPPERKSTFIPNGQPAPVKPVLPPVTPKGKT